MVEHGLDSTVGATLEMMILHGASVVRGSSSALVVVDMPFGSYEESPAVAFRNASRLMAETGCGAVKLEGGSLMAETIAFLTSRGIPVMAHIGLTPQAVNTFGGFKTQGRDPAGWDAIKADAVAVSDAGAFAVVVEGVVEPLGVELTQAIPIPTIGIGASAQCDGQVLVIDDMLGMFDRTARFVKRYDELAARIDQAAGHYAAEVRSRAFPGSEQTYQSKD